MARRVAWNQTRCRQQRRLGKLKAGRPGRSHRRQHPKRGNPLQSRTPMINGPRVADVGREEKSVLSPLQAKDESSRVPPRGNFGKIHSLEFLSSQIENAMFTLLTFSITYYDRNWQGIPAPRGHLDFWRCPNPDISPVRKPSSPKRLNDQAKMAKREAGRRLPFVPRVILSRCNIRARDFPGGCVPANPGRPLPPCRTPARNQWPLRSKDRALPERPSRGRIP